MDGQVAAPGLNDATLKAVKQAVREVLAEEGKLDLDLELGKRWTGGTLIFKPGKTETASKAVPIEAFFKKIIGVRDKLRVLEQKINGNPKLSPEEKIELEGYITRCYGSLTTFNVLFAAAGLGFKGTGKEE